MKRTITIALLACLLIAVLSGCGSYRADGNNWRDSNPVPSVSPMPGPDYEDGLVEDQDGLLDNDRDGILDSDLETPRPNVSHEPVKP